MIVFLIASKIMKTITIGNQKGGTGKTTLTISIAAELAKTSKVILIDADPQGNASNTLLKSMENELANVLYGECTVDKAISKTDVENLFILPTSSLSPKLRTYKMNQASAEPFIFCDLKAELEKLNFDFCVIDTSPSFEALEEDIYQATDEIIPVMLLDLYSLDGFSIFKKLLEGFQKRKRHNPILKSVIVNNCDGRKSISNQIKEQMKNSNYKLFEILSDQSFQRAVNARVPIQKMKGAKKEVLSEIELIAQEIRK